MSIPDRINNNLQVVLNKDNEIYKSVIADESGFEPDPPLTWENVFTGFESGNFQDVAYGNGNFVMVGETAQILVSPDGIDWTYIDVYSPPDPFGVPFSTTFERVIFGGGQFLACGWFLAAELATSPDGITWTRQTLNLPPGFAVFGRTSHAIAYGNGVYVLTARLGNIATSPDGVNWTARTAPNETSIYSASFENGLFLIGNNNGDISTSPDGINWTAYQSMDGFGGSDWVRDITFGNGLYVTVGDNGSLSTSPDTVNWTGRTSSFGTSDIYSVKFINNTFIATGAGGQVATSPDGITWTQINNNHSPSTIVTGLAVGEGLYVTSGRGEPISITEDLVNWVFRLTRSPLGKKVANVAYSDRDNLFLITNGRDLKYSPDGINWSDSIQPLGPGETIYTGSVTLGNTAIIAGADGRLATSTDGLTWTSRDPGFGVSGIFCSETQQIVDTLIAGADGKFASSSDGITWTSKATPFGVNSILAIGSSYVSLVLTIIIGGQGGLLATTSGLGDDWTLQDPQFGTDNINGITFGNSIFVAVGNNGKLSTSPDGATWTARTSSFGVDNINAVIYQPTDAQFVAVGNSGKLATSPDGITWTQQTTTFGTTNINTVTYGFAYVIAGDEGKLSESNDLITWTDRDSNFVLKNIESIFYYASGGQKYILTGENGILTQAPASDTSFWQVRVSQFEAQSISALNFGNNLYIVGGNNGRVVTSPDRINWTSRDAGFKLSTITILGYENGIFFAGSTAGKLAISVDGVNWTQQTISGAASISEIVYGNKTYMVRAGQEIFISLDLSTWTQQNIDFEEGTNLKIFRAITFGFDIFVLVGYTYEIVAFLPVILESKIATSPDGTRWQLQDNNFGTSGIESVHFGLNTFIAGGGNGKTAISFDGKTWEQRTGKFSDNLVEEITSSGSLFLAGGAVTAISTGEKNPEFFKPWDLEIGALASQQEWLKNMGLELLKQLSISTASGDLLKYQLENFFGSFKLEGETEADWVFRTQAIVLNPKLSRAAIIYSMRPYSSQEPEVERPQLEAFFMDYSYMDIPLQDEVDVGGGEIIFVLPAIMEETSSPLFTIRVILYDTPSSQLTTVRNILDRTVADGIEYLLTIATT